MAFSFRKIISNIGYFKQPDDDHNESLDPQSDLDVDEKVLSPQLEAEDVEIINFERPEPDSTSVQNSVEFSSSLTLPESVKTIATKKGYLSDTDLLAVSLEKPKKEKKKIKKLKLDVEKANQSFDENSSRESVENTPKHVLLECRSSEIFSERMKQFDFSGSFEIDSDHSSYEEENLDIESLSEDDLSLESEGKTSIKMCRKVGTESQMRIDNMQLVPSASPESFADVEVDKNEEERITLLSNYQTKFEKMESCIKKLLTEFQFHIEVSKIFNSKSFVTAISGTDVSNVPKLLVDVKYTNKISRGISPAESWNIILEKEDIATKIELKNHLLSIQNTIEEFIKKYLNTDQMVQKYTAPKPCKRRNTYFLLKGKKCFKKLHTKNKKKIKHFDFPDIRDEMLKLFAPDDHSTDINNSFDDCEKCGCRCHDTSQTDSGLTTKSEDHSTLITSSIGNFSLDVSTLSAYSESLDDNISYKSFEDTSLYSTLLQKAAIERITFYIQVHSIQVKCEMSDHEFESKSAITFYCPSCKTTDREENSLLKHILSQAHCEKIHFLYKTAYIKKCVASGKEIQPSTVLNPMRMYRDDNKIVCFGDALYACTLCFENLIIGESILMAHCTEQEHVERREKLEELLE